MPVLPPIPPSTTDRVLDAGAVSRTYRIEDGTVRTVSIRGDQGEVAVAGPELAIVVDGVRYDDGALVLADPPEPGDGTTLSWTVATPDDTVHVTVLVTAWPGSDVIRKSAFVTGAGRLDRIELELWEGVEMRGFASPDRVSPDRAPSGALQGSDPGPGSLGLGQPVHGPGFFAGIEHPGAENLTTAGGCRCSISYGVVLDGLQAVVSPTAVVGSGDFFDYLESIHPHADQVLVVAETRTHPQPPASSDEAAVRRPGRSGRSPGRDGR